MSYTRTVEPTEEPVSREELKAHCRVEITEDDDLIDALGIAAREKVEIETGRALCTQTWILYSNTFPTVSTTPIEIHKVPVKTVTIAYTDTNGVAATWLPADFQVDITSEPALILPAYGESYPTARDVYKSVVITIVCGYGAAYDVPVALKHAIKMLVGTWYEHREQIIIGQAPANIPAPVAYESLIYPYRMWSF